MNYKVRKGRMEALAYHEATGTASTYTFTPSKAITNDKYSKVVIVIDYLPTATHDLGLQFNGETSGYAWARELIASGGSTIATSASDSDIIIGTTSLIVTVNSFATIDILMSDDATDKGIQAFIMHGAGRQYEHSTGSLLGQTEITSITILTSTSTWNAGTKFSIYGLRR